MTPSTVSLEVHIAWIPPHPKVRVTLQGRASQLFHTAEAEARLMACPRPWEINIHQWPELESGFPQEGSQVNFLHVTPPEGLYPLTS